MFQLQVSAGQVLGGAGPVSSVDTSGSTRVPGAADVAVDAAAIISTEGGAVTIAVASEADPDAGASPAICSFTKLEAIEVTVEALSLTEGV